MEILEYKNQNIIVKEGEDKKFLIPVFNTSLLEGEGIMSVQIDFEIKDNASVQVYVLGVLKEGVEKILLNSVNSGKDSSFDAKVGFVLFGTSSIDFSGLMKIEKGAKGSQAKLYASSLLLSPHAKSTLIPSLEINENDVHANHGAIVKSIDPDQIFYLRSRGLPLGVANEILIEGFLNSLGVELPEEVKDQINSILIEELSKRQCPLDCEWCK